jgi:serine/threonine protein kinase
LTDVAPPDLPDLDVTDLILVGALGEGAAARIYRAWMADKGGWCAVKVLKEGASPRTHQRFVDEGRLLRELSHRNLIKVLHLGEGAQPWFLMEIADGGSLRDWCARFGRMPPRLAVDATIQVCKGIAVAHQAGVIHRDVKPHNVLINRSGVCKVTDFGIARLRNHAFGDGGEDPTLRPDTLEALGTLGYMAPEQHADPSSVDAGADLYAIGATLFHLLRGEAPPGNLFMATREYPELWRDIPDALVPVLQRATSFRRADRQASAMDLARELHATWEFLPPIGRDSPTLTTGIPLEPAPPPGMLKRTPITLSSVDGTMQPSTDGVPPEVLAPRPLTPAPRPPRERRRPPTVEPPAGTGKAAKAVVVAVALSATLLAADAGWVHLARRACLRAQAGFEEVARANAAVIDELGSAGADRVALAAAYDAVRDGTPRERHAAAQAWVAALAAATPEDARIGTLVRSRQQALEGALAPWSEALSTWDRRSGGLPGSLVTPLVGGPDTPGGDGR